MRSLAELLCKRLTLGGDPASTGDPADGNRREAYHVRRAAFGCWACTHDDQTRRDIIGLKRSGWSPAGPELYAAELTRLIRAWSPVLPAGWAVSTPPQGASAPGPYFAADLARQVADLLGLPYTATLKRTDTKPRHGLALSLAQTPYELIGTPPPVVFVVDDLISSGTTMRLSLSALRAGGTAAFGFASNCS